MSSLTNRRAALQAKRVEAGAAYMDEHFPGWAEDLDLDTLNIAFDEFCVIGQVTGSYNDFQESPFAIDNPVDLGFVVVGPVADKALNYRFLAALWQHEARKRLPANDTAKRHRRAA